MTRSPEKQKHETAINQIRSLKDKLFPDNGLQERKENFLNFFDGKLFYVINDFNLDDKTKIFWMDDNFKNGEIREYFSNFYIFQHSFSQVPALNFISENNKEKCPRCGSDRLFAETDYEQYARRAFDTVEVTIETNRCRICNYNPFKRKPKNLFDRIRLNFQRKQKQEYVNWDIWDFFK